MAASLQWTEFWPASHSTTNTGLRINHRPSGYVLIAGRTGPRWLDWPVKAYAVEPITSATTALVALDVQDIELADQVAGK
jgi:hypothetical protein